MPKPKITTSTFQVSDDLDNETVIAEYLSSAAQDENLDGLLKALGDVAKVPRHSASGQGFRHWPRKPLQSPQPRCEAEV
jgi:hypothetical protein